MRVQLDKILTQRTTSGALYAAPGRHLYVLETNGSLDRTIDPDDVEATETLVTGYTTETGATEVTYPLNSNSDGRFPNAWYDPQVYDLYCPQDLTNPIVRWQPTTGALEVELDEEAAARAAADAVLTGGALRTADRADGARVVWSSTAGALVAANRPFRVVTDPPYNADGTGAANTHIEIQEALDEGVGIAFVTSGSYKLGAALTVGDNRTLWMADGVTLLVNAESHAVKNADQTNGNTNVRIIGGKIDGQKAGRTAGATLRGIYMVKVDGAVVEGTHVTGAEDHGIHLSSCTRFRLAGCHTYSNGKNATSVGGSGIAVSCLSDCTGSISDCHSHNNFRAGFRYASVGTGADIYARITTTGCHAYVNGGDGTGADRSSTNPEAGFSLQGDGVSGKLIGCTYAACVSYLNVGDGFRWAAGVRGAAAGSCIAWGNTRNGLAIYNGCDYNGVNGGTYINNGDESDAAAGSYDGIKLYDIGTGSLHNTVTGIRATDTRGTKLQGYGIRELNAANFNRYLANDLAGNLSGTILLTGTSSGAVVEDQNFIVRQGGDTGSRIRLGPGAAGASGRLEAGIGGSIDVALFRDAAGARWETLQALRVEGGVSTKDLGDVAGLTSAQIDTAWGTPTPVNGSIATGLDGVTIVLLHRRAGKWNKSLAFTQIA